METFLHFFIFAVLVALAHSNVIREEDNDESAWFHHPIQDGSTILAKLTPTPGNKAGSVSDVHFYLYTHKFQGVLGYEEIFVDNHTSIDNSHYNKSRPLKFLVHGFGAGINGHFPQSLREAFTQDKRPETLSNVIVLDYSVLSAGPDYFFAVENVPLVAEHTAKLFKFLIDKGLTSYDQIHIIGYSLGGQVVGQIGWQVQQISGGEKLARITALDPANPLFDMMHTNYTTDQEDAIFVDVIHTSANGILGYYNHIGHVDWYPNGGRFQPNCGIDFSGGCGHGRAPALFIESVHTDKPIMGRECENYEKFKNGPDCLDNTIEILGYHTPITTRGTFFLDTNYKEPFASPLPK